MAPSTLGVPDQGQPRGHTELAATTETISWDEARNRAYAAPVPLPAYRVQLTQAIDLTLAGELCALTSLPAFDTSAMDGYAVAGTGPYRIVGRAVAGAGWGGILRRGEAVEICTGAPIPIGATAVLRAEHAVQIGRRVHGPSLTPGTHIRRTGEDAAAGACLAPIGTPVIPSLLGLAATAGHDTLLVHPKPAIAVLVTGDELIATGPSGFGQVRDALSPMLPALIDNLGGQVTELRHVRDQPAGELASAIQSATHGVSVVVVTGSTSVGATDRLRPFLNRVNAKRVVDNVACKPGHPQILARLNSGCWVVGLPGNPYAALAAAHTVLAALLAGLAGRRPPALPTMTICGAVPTQRKRQTYLLPVSWDGAAARVVAGHQPAFLRGAALADGLAVIRPEWMPGQSAPVLR